MLTLYDVVVLLGMVVPIELEDAAEAAVDPRARPPTTRS